MDKSGSKIKQVNFHSLNSKRQSMLHRNLKMIDLKMKSESYSKQERIIQNNFLKTNFNFQKLSMKNRFLSCSWSNKKF